MNEDGKVEGGRAVEETGPKLVPAIVMRRAVDVARHITTYQSKSHRRSNAHHLARAPVPHEKTNMNGRRG